MALRPTRFSHLFQKQNIINMVDNSSLDCLSYLHEIALVQDANASKHFVLAKKNMDTDKF